MKTATILPLALASLISISAHASVLPQTFLSFSSDPGDSIGQGHSYFFTPPSGHLVVNTSPTPISSISFFYDPGLGFPWSGGFFSSGRPGTALTVGQYNNAQWNGSSSNGEPGLNLYVENRGSNHTSGSFHIYDLTFNALGLVNSLAATFEQHSDGSAGALHGALWVNSLATVPVSVPEPASYTLLLAGLALLSTVARKGDVSD